jgi:hypothetical protein
MKSLQAVIDAAFGELAQPNAAAPASARPAQAPSADFLARGRTFIQRAQAIEALRQRRLSSEALPLEALTFEIVRFRGYWRTLHARKHSGAFPDQAAAVLAAKKQARKKRDLGHPVKVILRRTDGTSVLQSLDDDQCASRSSD